MFENLVAASSRCNMNLSDADELVANIAAEGVVGVLFANPTGGSTGSYMIPEKPKQANGSAMWVDTSTDLTTMGVPRDLPIYLQIWVESKKDYYVAAMVAKSLSRGETVAMALE